jgi:glycosyltransferase involved in cell wall biosynthesis
MTLRIALVAPLVTQIREPQLGGSQALLADIAGGLARRGHLVKVFAASGSEIPGVRVVDTGVSADLLAASFYRHGTQPASDGPVAAAFKRVFRLVAAERFDIVHNHAFDGPAIEAASALGSQVVHTLHLPPHQPVVEAVRRAQAGPRPPTVVGVSRQQGLAWRAHVRIDGMLRNGVPVTAIPFIPEPGRRLLFAGRFSPEKGARTAIEIAIAGGHNIDVVGSPYDVEYSAALERDFADNPRVRFHPPLQRATLWRVMGEARAVLCPVDWEEPFGLVAAEAQAAGTPVVAFRRGALPEVVSDSLTGFLVADAPAAVQALKRIDEIGRSSCRRHAQDNLDLERCLDAHETLYRRLYPVPGAERAVTR